MKKLKQKYRCMDEWKYGNGKTTGCPTETLGHDRRCGFTLVEMVIVIAVVIILSVISVPIYRSYTEKAKLSEGYALLGTILSAQKAYYSEYGNFLKGGSDFYTSYNSSLGIDARGNKYFTWFQSYDGEGNLANPAIYCAAGVMKPSDLQDNNSRVIWLQYNITKGVKVINGPWDQNWRN